MPACARPRNGVGILTEPNRFVHAYERLGVIEEPLTEPWRRRIAFAFLFPRVSQNRERVPAATRLALLHKGPT
jgi:hypothetical protein